MLLITVKVELIATKARKCGVGVFNPNSPFPPPHKQPKEPDNTSNCRLPSSGKT